MDNRFNLIDEPWIPVADFGRVSLKEVFSRPELRALGGNPIQKIALTKLLLAIAQAAATPKDDEHWQQMGWQGMADKCLSYLHHWHDRFYLYGEKPFLQMPGVKDLLAQRATEKLQSAKTKAKEKEARDSVNPKDIGTGEYPDIWAENNTILFSTLSPKTLDDGDKALYLVSMMNFAFGGKRTEKGLVNFSGERLGDKYSAPAGPSLGGFVGQAHCYCLSGSLLETIWLNLFSQENLSEQMIWQSVGTPPWEQMPVSETDDVSVSLSQSYMATLLSLSRFILLSESGVSYLDGIKYPKVKDGWTEASLAINRQGNEPKVMYVNLEKKPWRDLSALLNSSDTGGYEILGLKWAIKRARRKNLDTSIWIGGLRVSPNSGDQSVKQNDDFLESSFAIHHSFFGSYELLLYQSEIDALNTLVSYVKRSIENYFHKCGDPKPSNPNKKAKAKVSAANAERLFWQLCERQAQALIDACDNSEEGRQQRIQLRKVFAGYAYEVFDRTCPNHSARQMDAWAQSRPNFSKYLKAE